MRVQVLHGLSAFYEERLVRLKIKPTVFAQDVG